MRVIQGFERGAVACFWSCDVFLFIWFSLHFPQLSSGCKMSYKNQSPSPYSYSCGDFICWKHKTRLKYVQLLVVDRYTRPILEWFLVNRKILLTTLQINRWNRKISHHSHTGPGVCSWCHFGIQKFDICRGSRPSLCIL